MVSVKVLRYFSLFLFLFGLIMAISTFLFGFFPWMIGLFGACLVFLGLANYYLYSKRT